jgi:nitroreductase
MYEYPSELNRGPGALDLLLSRRSGSKKAMTGPGPDKEQVRQILAAAARVPDHGKLVPWRFLLFEGEGRARMGEVLADVLRQEDDSPERLALERERFLRAPVVIGVVSRRREMLPIPVWEQELSAGAVCMNLLIAAHALGFVANWITEWCAYHPQVLARIGLKPGERIAGYVYIGQPTEPIEDRPRPDIDALTTHF